MSTICIAWRGVVGAINGYSSARMDLSSNIATLRSIKAYRYMSGYGFSSIYSTLDRIIQKLDDEKNSIKALENGLSNILNAYSQYENDIFGHTKMEEIEFVEATAAYAAIDSSQIAEWDDFWKAVSQGGIIGSAVAGIGGLITCGWSPGSTINAVDSILSAVGGVSGTVAKGSNANWRDALLGMDDGLAGINTSSAGKAFTSSLKNQFVDDLSFSQASTVGDKIKVGTKWGGHALTLLSNIFDNVEEFEGQDGATGRMVTEIAVETVTDIGVGAVATAAVTAGAAALGITAAPAVVIGAGAVAVTWAANEVCEWITGGKDIGEVASDLVCGAAEAIGNAVSNTAKAVGDGFNAVVNWGKSLFSW